MKIRREKFCFLSRLQNSRESGLEIFVGTFRNFQFQGPIGTLARFLLEDVGFLAPCAINLLALCGDALCSPMGEVVLRWRVISRAS